MPDILKRIHPVLVRPDIPENIGAAVRAAAAGGLGAVRLVAPHAPIDGRARALASGAGRYLTRVKSFPDLDAALADVGLVAGFTSRHREHRVPPGLLPEAVPAVLKAARAGKVALLFGTERTGLENDEIDRANLLVRIPTSPVFRSINLAQSVMIAAYALRAERPAALPRGERSDPPAPAREVEGALRALEEALDARDFFQPHKKSLAMRRIRDLIGRGGPRLPEIALLRGMIRALDQKRRP